jgi:hypothetical protein
MKRRAPGMARGKKTGGRNFTKGDPRAGRPKGSKDKIPRTWKGSIKAIFEAISSEQPELLRDAMVKGLKAKAPKSFPYLQLAVHYIDGRPRQAIELTGADDKPITFTLRLDPHADEA